MSDHADQTEENKSESVASSAAQMQTISEPTFEYLNTRPESIAQMKLQEMANNSSQVSQLQSFQDFADNSPQAKQAAQLHAASDMYSVNQQQPIQRVKNSTGSLENIEGDIEGVANEDSDEGSESDEVDSLPKEIEVPLPTSFTASSAGLFENVMNNIDRSWISVKDHFKKAENSQEPSPIIFNPLTRETQMNALLKYRRHVTVDKNNSESVMSKAKSKLEKDDPRGSEETEEDYLDWDAAGSDDFTSDIDLNIMGSKSELASQYAFSFFREDWIKESGEVFDVNFYARDWKPKKLKEGLKAANEKFDANAKDLDKSALTETEFEGKGDADEAKRTEKINSIAKLIRDMQGLSPEIKVAVRSALVGAEGGAAAAAWAGGEETVAKWKDAVRESGSDGDSEAKKENLAYAGATSELAACRTALDGATNENKEELEGKLLAARLKAAFYGPEAYVTEAAFIHGVINKQIQSTTFKVKGDKENKINIKLNKDELLQVIIENVGFAFHHFNELSSSDPETKNMGYSAVAKYVYRACNAIKHMGVKDFSELSVMAKNTVLEKKKVAKREKEGVDGSLSDLEPEFIKDNLIQLLSKANNARTLEDASED